jgi:three-Cys-motif partner protein
MYFEIKSPRKEDRVVGCSESSTRSKWERLDYIGTVLSRMVRNIMDINEWVSRDFLFFDAHAGHGIYSETDHVPSLAGSHGSPLRILKILNQELPNNYVAYFSEPEKETARRLLGSVESLGFKAFVANETHEEAIDNLIALDKQRSLIRRGTPFGLAFFDPNKSRDLSWRHLEDFARRFRYVDLLINVPSTDVKRLRTAPLCVETKTLQDLVEPLRMAGGRKRYVYLWKPKNNDRNKFTLIFVTGYDKFPEFKKQGFHRDDTPDGRAIFDDVNRTEKERRSNGNRNDCVD